MELSQRVGQILPSSTLAIDSRAKEMAAAGENVVNFGVGEPDFDTPSHIKEAAVAAIKSGKTKYTPVGGTAELKAAIIGKLRDDNGLSYGPEEIVVSVGGKHSLYNAIQVLCQDGDEVILPSPYWVSYLEQIKLAGAKPVIIQTLAENGFKVTTGQLEESITGRTKLFILNSPNNPTGSVYSRKELEAIGEILVKYGIAIISDEIYEKLLYEGEEHVSIASLSPALKELTVIVNGVSKSYAMTGWRIGYTASQAPVAKAMADLQSHMTSNPTSVAQEAAVAALKGTQAPLAEMLKEFNLRRVYMYERLASMPGLTCTRPVGAFYAFPGIHGCIGRSYNGRLIDGATGLASILLEEAKVAVVPGAAFGDDNFVRLSYAASIKNIAEGLNRMEKILANLK